jgi:NAD+ synthase
MIRDLGATVAYLVDWVKGEAERSKTKGATVGVSGGVDSALVLAICVKAFGPENCRAVLMPCHSTKTSTDRGTELVTKFKVPAVTIDLSDAWNVITRQLEGKHDFYSANVSANFANGALRSCLRAPTLDYVAKLNNHLVYGTGNRDEDAIFRYYQKRGDGAVDNNPIVALHKSEVYDLAAYLGVPKSILEAPPTADLWGPDSGQEDEKELGVTYPEVEWVTRENDRNQDTLDASTPREALEVARCQAFTKREWFVIEKARVAEVSTRHKAQLPPGTDRYDMVKQGLVV